MPNQSVNISHARTSSVVLFFVGLHSISYIVEITMMTSSSATSSVVDPAIFGYLQAKIDEESQVREELRNIVQTLEKQGI